MPGQLSQMFLAARSLESFRNRHDEQRSRHFIFLEPGPLRFGSNTEFIYLMISSFKEGWLNLWMGKILLVDDNDTLAVMIKKMLEIGDYEVIRAKNGNDALRLYDSKTIDLVLTDLIMPEKEGIQLISELRHINPAIKIVAMSGGGIVGPQVTLPIAKHLGAIRTLTKPFTADELLTTIEYALHGTT